MRLQIARPLEEDMPMSHFKVIEFTRLPLRLGDEVFLKGEISRKKIDLLKKAMQAFALLMEIYNVDGYMACATSAMRDAVNSQKIIREIKKETGIQIKVITGQEESRIIQRAVMDMLPGKDVYLHIDVGGGSTEMTLLKGGKPKMYESFDIGTVRMKEGKVRKSEGKRLLDWLKVCVQAYPVHIAIGTGGNIVKLHQLAGKKQSEGLRIEELEVVYQRVLELDHHDRVYHLELNPDRAEVIDQAGKIFLDIMATAGIDEIYAPNKGLKDGIIRGLWLDHLKKHKLIVPE